MRLRATAMFRAATILSVVCALALACSICQGQGIPRPTYRKLTLPGGRPFPASQASLLCLRDKADQHAVKKMREHAWQLFAGLTKGKDPIWTTWYTKCDLGLMQCSEAPGDKDSPSRLLNSFELPAQFLQQFAAGAGLLRNDQAVKEQDLKQQRESALILLLENFLRTQIEHPQFASVLFDEEAETHIVGECLHPWNFGIRGPVKDPCTPSRPKLDTPTKIKDFEPGSVVLKTTWAHVPKEGGRINTYNSCVWKTI